MARLQVPTQYVRCQEYDEAPARPPPPRSEPLPPTDPKRSIEILRLPDAVSKLDLYKHFSSVGEVRQVKRYDPALSPELHATVEFESALSVHQALRDDNRYIACDGTLIQSAIRPAHLFPPSTIQLKPPPLGPLVPQSAEFDQAVRKRQRAAEEHEQDEDRQRKKGGGRWEGEGRQDMVERQRISQEPLWRHSLSPPRQPQAEASTRCNSFKAAQRRYYESLEPDSAVSYHDQYAIQQKPQHRSHFPQLHRPSTSYGSRTRASRNGEARPSSSQLYTTHHQPPRNPSALSQVPSRYSVSTAVVPPPTATTAPYPGPYTNAPPHHFPIPPKTFLELRNLRAEVKSTRDGAARAREELKALRAQNDALRTERNELERKLLHAEARCKGKQLTWRERSPVRGEVAESRSSSDEARPRSSSRVSTDGRAAATEEARRRLSELEEGRAAAEKQAADTDAVENLAQPGPSGDGGGPAAPENADARGQGDGIAGPELEPERGRGQALEPDDASSVAVEADASPSPDAEGDESPTTMTGFEAAARLGSSSSEGEEDGCSTATVASAIEAQGSGEKATGEGVEAEEVGKRGSTELGEGGP